MCIINPQYFDDFQASNSLLKTLSSIHEKLAETQSPCPNTLDASGTHDDSVNAHTTDPTGLLLVNALCLVEDIGWKLKSSPSQRYSYPGIAWGVVGESREDLTFLV